ncbi:type II CAAX endopeptidase family protein [Dyella sp. C11]|uniref:CPBP family intramembrane glutamic endopeptidase n=1 Tax=Dyella sp. C11 TaxID=2126991 RepID=UPI000D648E83|nr:type II CAAX endopeptidase family protein [Dyella sp. C11]
MDANRLIDLPVAPPYPMSRAPTPWHALALIALYFVLQLAVGSLITLVAGLVAMLRDGAGLGELVHLGREWLGRSDMTALAVILTLLVSAGVIVHLARRWWPSWWSVGEPPGLGFTGSPHIAFYIAALCIGMTMPILGGMLTQWLAQGHEVSQDIKQLGANTSLALRLPLALLVITIGPMVEELLFRGALLSALTRYTGNAGAIVVSALLFACVHLPDLSFLWYALPNLALLGLVLGWLRVQSGSIWPAIIAHGMNNLLAVVSWFVISS